MKDRGAGVKERIVDVSIKLFLSNGYIGTTVSEITKAANIAKGTLYCHFDNKGQVLEAVVDRFSQEFYEVAMKKTVIVEGGFIPKFHAMYRFLCEFSRDNRELVAVFTTLQGEIVGSQSPCEAKMKAVEMKFHGFIKALLDEGAKEGVVRRDADTDIEAHIIVATFVGMHLHWYLHGDSIDAVKYTRRLRENILNSISNPMHLSTLCKNEIKCPLVIK